MIGSEIDRLESQRKLPQGRNNYFMLGGGPVTFNNIGGQIAVEPLKNAGILQLPISINLKPGTKLNWRRIVEELPSRLPEDQIMSRDYRSIGTKHDNGHPKSLISLWNCWRATLDSNLEVTAPDGEPIRIPRRYSTLEWRQ